MTNKEERMKQRRRERKQKQRMQEALMKALADGMREYRPGRNGAVPYNVMSTLPDIRPDFKVKVR